MPAHKATDLCLHSFILQVIMAVLLEISCSWQDSIISEPAGGDALAQDMHHAFFVRVREMHQRQSECGRCTSAEAESTRTWQRNEVRMRKKAKESTSLPHPSRGKENTGDANSQLLGLWVNIPVTKHIYTDHPRHNRTR